VRAHATDLYRYAYWLCRDRHRAEDIVQDSLTRAWQAWDTLRDSAATKSWLFAIVRNEYLRSFERKPLERDERQPEELDLHEAPQMDITIDMRRALHALPLSLREPLLLQVLGGFSCREIARSLKTTEGAVMTRLTRARLAMRKLFGHDAANVKAIR
jgi:RNA polymerase sigma-70 factor (ECF subfamily)